jgi:phosphoglycerate dehydrogenase-like enzyme
MMTIRWRGRNNPGFGIIRNVDPVREKQQPGVVVYRPADRTGDSHRQLSAAGCRVEVVEEGEDLAQALRAAAPVHALLASSLRGLRLDAATLASLPELRLVAKYSIGVDDVDIEAASARAVLVTHCPTEANYGGVAEGTIALMLSLLKKIPARDRAVRSGAWRSEALQGTYVGSRADGYPGIVIGIVGLGRVGRRVADLLAPWRARLLATDPYIDPAVFARHGARPVALDELLAQSDVVSLHCPLTDETRGLIGRSRIARMQPHAVLINTARGAVVDVDAVCDALETRRLGGAALDVLPEEPPPARARILAMDERVILSPHMVAANTGGTLAAAVPWATEAVLAALAGRVPDHVYDPAAIAAWKTKFAGRSLLAPARSVSPS